MKLLLIEDDRSIAFALSQALSSIYDVDTAHTGIGGIHKAENQDYDGVILDLRLPDLPGLAVCQRLRAAHPDMAILILTGEGSVLQKITLLDAGADDYLTKPVSLGELKVRLRVVTRRGNLHGNAHSQLSFGDLELNGNTREVIRNGCRILLRRKEFDLLECLLHHAGNVVSREALTRYAWREAENPWTNTVDVHIKHLRDKVDRPFGHSLIKTVHGVGYKLELANIPTGIAEVPV